MAAIKFGTNAFPTRLCVIVTSSASGGPIAGVPFFCHASVNSTAASAPAATASPLLDMPLGTLATDLAGYLSFDLSVLERRLEDLQQQQIVAGVDTQIELSNLWVQPFSPIAQSIDVLAVDNVIDDAIVLRLMVDPNSVYTSDGNGFASMQAPGLTDWYLSPGSFANLSAAIVGQDGCETLLPSNIATQQFQFVQVLALQQSFPLLVSDPKPTYQQLPNHQFLAPQVDITFAMQIANKIANKSVELAAGIPPGIATLGLAMYVTYDATWLPVGHGLGQIVYSMPLAPAEQVNIAIIDWSRTSVDSRVENTGLTDTLQHDTTRDRTIGEVVDATVREWQRGGSIMGGASVTGGYGGMVGAAASIGGAYQTSSGDRNVSASTVQNLADRFSQVSTAIRDLRSTVVVQSSQQESQNLQTRTVRNYNHSHALTVLYYEVLRHYRTVVERGGVGPALLIPQAMPNFDEVAVFNYRRFLEPALLISELDPGFDAGETLFALDSDPPPAPPPDPAAITYNLFRIIFHCGASTSQAAVSAEIRPSNYAGTLTSLTGADGGSDLGLNLRFVDAANNSVEVQAIPDGGSVAWSDIGFFAITVTLIPDKTHDNESLRLDVGLVEVRGVDSNGVDRPLGSWNGNQTYAGPSAEIFPIITVIRPPAAPVPLSPLQQLPIDQRHVYARLIAHLNGNKSYYYKQIWMAEEPNTRAARFKDLSVTIGAVTVPLLSAVENRVLDVFGGNLVMPMDPSYFSSGAISQGDRQLLALPEVAHARSEQLISLPTRGVFAEAKLGHCNASEVIDNSRFWDWQTSPIPDLAPQITGIAPISPQAPANVTPTAFPATVLSIQQPAPAPDPIGLRAALDVLKTPGIFNNMSGIQQLQGLLTTLTNAAVQAQGISGQNKGNTSSPASAAPAGANPAPSGSSGIAANPSGSSTSGGGSAAPTSETSGAGAAASPDGTSFPVAPTASAAPDPVAPTTPASPTPVKPSNPVTPAKPVTTRNVTIQVDFVDNVEMHVVSVLCKENAVSAIESYLFIDEELNGPVSRIGYLSVQNPASTIRVTVQANIVRTDGSEVMLRGFIDGVKLTNGGSTMTIIQARALEQVTHPFTKTTTVIPASLTPAVAGQMGVSVLNVFSVSVGGSGTFNPATKTTTYTDSDSYTAYVLRDDFGLTSLT